MLKKNKNDNNINMTELNNVIELSKKVLHVLYFMLVMVAIFVFIRIGKELKIFSAIITILSIVSPLFIGMIIAWLLNPLVTWLQKQGVRRVLATFIVYFTIIGLISFVFTALVPSLYSQVNDFASMIPTTYDSIKNWIDELFEKLNYQNSIDFLKIKEELLGEISKYGEKFAQSLPDIVISAISSLISGIGTIFVSLVIGFFLIIGFENTDALIDFLPKRIQNNTRELLFDVNLACRSFVTGSLIDCLFIFFISSIGLYFVGLKAPLLFGLFCGVTNIIPYLGPYLGGIPAVIIGFTQSTSVGILTLIVIGIIQLLEGNLLQPIILSKTTKLHPITIMLGLLVFGHFFGIVGMVIATPLMAAFKAIILFFDKKYDILDIN